MGVIVGVRKIKGWSVNGSTSGGSGGNNDDDYDQGIWVFNRGKRICACCLYYSHSSAGLLSKAPSGRTVS